MSLGGGDAKSALTVEEENTWSGNVMYLGIDPGVSGAVATSEGWVESLPILGEARKRRLDAVGLDEMMLYDDAIPLCVIERQNPRPGEGVSSTMTSGIIYGGLIAWLQLSSIPYIEALPSQWKRHLGLSGKDKEAFVTMALSLYPSARSSITGPRGGKNHNIAEALLLATYAKRLSNG